jgi:Flp pilus assembly protein TadG
MRFLIKKRGQTLASAVVATVLLLVVASGLVDGLNLLSTKQRCLEIASAASLRGVSRGRDYTYYLSTGQIGLDVFTAQSEATSMVDAGMTEMGLSGYTVQVEVLDAPGGGSISNFPPGRTWTETEPSVGIYMIVPVDTFLMGLINGGGPVDVHVFAAAGVTTQ